MRPCSPARSRGGSFDIAGAAPSLPAAAEPLGGGGVGPPVAGLIVPASCVTGPGGASIGVGATHKEAVGLVADRTPGLVLADVRLADGSSGIEAVGDILKSYDVPVVFITAYPERLLTGDRPEPAFLITKPFSDETVKAMIGQALFFHQPRPRLKAVV